MDELTQQCYEDYKSKLDYYKRIQSYYQNESDVVIETSDLIQNTSEKIKHNYFKKFVKNEANYILGNQVTYVAQGADYKEQITETCDNFAHWDENHNLNLFRKALTYGIAYELYYTKKDSALFSAKRITPLNGYVYAEDGEVKLFLHIFKKKFSDSTHIDVYDQSFITHYKDGEPFGAREPHYFKGVPVGICDIAGNDKDMLYEDIKTLQDAYERNISDMSLELTQYRLAYLKVINAKIEDEDLPEMKTKGIINATGANVSIDWLIKNINDTFVKNTTETIKKNLYELACHINNNEQVPSNNSSLAMRTRQLELENKCKTNIKAHTNLIKKRLKFLYQHMKRLDNKMYDYRRVKPKYTVSLPQDDVMIAQIISQLPEGYISKQTARAQFSFIDNTDNEEKLVAEEGERDIQEGLNLLARAKEGDISVK